MFLEAISVVGIGAYAHRYLKKRKSLAKLSKAASETKTVEKLLEHDKPLPEIVSADNLGEKTILREHNNRNVKISVASLSVATLGTLFYKPLILLSLPGILYVSHFTVQDAYRQLKKKKLTVDLLAAMTKVFLILYGQLLLASFSITLYSLNRKLLNKISDDSQKNLVDIFRQKPSKVWVVYEGIEREIAFEDLRVGDTVVVEAGNVIPADGVIAQGTASIDQHILTGESEPVEKAEGDEVFALTLVIAGKAFIHTRKTGSETTAAQIVDVLNNTITTKTDIELWSQQLGDKTVLPTLLMSGAVLPVAGPVGAIALVNSHFKYRASIASSVGVLQYLKHASRSGILVKDGRVFERIKQIDTIVFDKTGTLTEEQPQVVRIHSYAEYSEADVLGFAAAAETHQKHPIAKAILQEAQDRNAVTPEVEDTAYKLGYGLTVSIAKGVVRVGSIRFLQQEGIIIPESVLQLQKGCQDSGMIAIMVALNDDVIGTLELEARIRPGTKTMLAQFRAMGLTSMCIISGDHEAPTRKLAQELGITQYFAETLPEQKAELITRLQADGASVCYVGDGINDAIALKQANLSISISGATSVATDIAEIVLMDQSLEQLPTLFSMGQQFNGHMKGVIGAVVIPSVITLGGVLFFHISLLQSLILPQLGLLAGVATAMYPRNYRPEQAKLTNQHEKNYSPKH